MQKTWLLVAESSKAKLYAFHKARLFSQSNPNELELIAEFNHEASRKKGTELASDKWGGFGGDTFMEATSPKEREAEVFAQELVDQLELGRGEKTFRDIIIIAPANFMGLLTKNMSHEIKKLVCQTIEKNYTQKTLRELVDNLVDQIAS